MSRVTPAIRPFRVYGHRGNRRGLVENSREAFQQAMTAGADGFETDLRRLGDGSIVLFHDDAAGRDRLADLTLDSLRTTRPMVLTLSELREYVGQTTLILEVKESEWPNELVDALSNLHGPDSIIVSSFDHRLIQELRRRKVSWKLGLVVSAYLVDAAAYAKQLGVDFFFPEYHWVDRDLVDSMHKEGIEVIPWTANEAHEWARLRSVGCDGVICDDPAAAVRWRGAI